MAAKKTPLFTIVVMLHCLLVRGDLKQWLRSVDVNVTQLAREMVSDEWPFFADAYSGSYNATIRANELSMLEIFSEASRKAVDWKESADYEDLLENWTAARSQLGPMRNIYQKNVELGTVKSSDFFDLAHEITTVMPLYRQLHAYVRHKLQDAYGPHRMPATGHIPAHFVDGIGGVNWHKLYHQLRPYKFGTQDSLSSQVPNAEAWLRRLDDFYHSLDYERLPTSFWNSSIISPDNATNVICLRVKAWTFWRDDDLRISGCIDVSYQSMRNAAEMVWDILTLRDASRQKFVVQQEDKDDYVTPAIAGALSLAFFTPAQQSAAGLRPEGFTQEDKINFLLEVGLDRLTPLPFYNVISEWQTIVNQTTKENWNQEWWRFRCAMERVSAPVARSNQDFDAGTSISVILNVPGKRLFQTSVAQFQILRSLCRLAGHSGSLATCNLRGSIAVGQKIRSLTQQGKLTTPEKKLKVLTGSDSLEISALTEYFDSLREWLLGQASHSVNLLTACPDPATNKMTNPDEVKRFLKKYNPKAAEIFNQDSFLQWNYNTNITDYNQGLVVNNSLVTSRFQRDYAGQVAMFDLDGVDKKTKRALKGIANIGTDALTDEAKIRRLNEILAQMSTIYSTATVCLNASHCLPLDPDIREMMASSRDYDELTKAWKLWRDATGLQLKNLYSEFVTLGNEGVQKLGYTDMGQHWRDAYEDANFREELDNLMKELQPLYQQLHAYVRNRLMKVYGKDRFPKSGHIPAHILGNMWAQQWNNIYDLLLPYPKNSSFDVTAEMRRQNWTVERMFRVSEEFYTSLGMDKMPNKFWNYSMLERPAEGRKVVCHASAWNFFKGQDFRIKMCTAVNMEDLMTIHHEMGHIQYYMKYDHLPFMYKAGANPGFLETIGDTIALSVATPKHLNKIGLLKTLQANDDEEINFLLKMALEKIAFLPFGYLIDQWRWSVFSGETPPQHYNDKWWQLRCKFQGVSPPVERSEADFDPGAMYHVPNNVPYDRYFVSFVMQFTFYQRLCKAVGHTGPLHRCDFYQSLEAGKVLKEMLQKGSSEPWPDILEAFNGQRAINASAIIEYFKPLMVWLDKQNSGLPIGWNDNCSLGMTEKIYDERAAREWLQQVDKEAKVANQRFRFAAWAFNTNINDKNQKAQDAAALEIADWEKETAAKANRFAWKNFSDNTLVRMFRAVTDIGTSAMKNRTKLEKLNHLHSTLMSNYSTAAVQHRTTNHTLSESDLANLFMLSRDYEELLWAWQSWRNVTGRLMKDRYEQFVALSNEAVQVLGHADTGAYWRSSYESETFQADMLALMDQLSPLYTQLHAFVRRQLIKVYGADKFPSSGHIPAHLLGTAE